jgi:hypothetical protein
MATLLVAIGPAALAQPAPTAPIAVAQSQSFALHNLSRQPVVSALARMTDGQTRVLTHEPIQVGQVRWIVVPRKQCVAMVTVHLNDGRVLTADGLNDCRPSRMVVSDAGIERREGSRPSGAQQPIPPH